MKKLLFLCILSLCASMSLTAQSQPRTYTLFNLAHPGDSIEYIPVGRGNDRNVVEGQVFFSGLDCADLELAVGKSMRNKTASQAGGGIFPVSFGELDNPVTLDTTATDANSYLLFRKYWATGANTWNFGFKFIDWNSYYLVFIIADYGTCTEGTIYLVK